jgi:hypothetical protein
MLIKLFKLINDYKSNTTRFIMKFENATRFSAGKLGIGNAHRRLLNTDEIDSIRYCLAHCAACSVGLLGDFITTRFQF